MNLLETLDRPKWLNSHNDCSYLTVMGSRAYRTANENSDYDFYGFLIPPIEVLFPYLTGEILGFGRQIQRFEQVQYAHKYHNEYIQEYDLTIYNIVKYFQLVMLGNPNLLDSIFVPEDCIIYQDKIGEMVRNNRKLFLSEKTLHTYKGMLFSHLSRIKSGHIKEGRAKTSEKLGLDYDCYVGETEFLTDSGWKQYHDIVSSDKLATINKNDFSLVFQKYTDRFSKTIQDKIYTINSDVTKSKITINHKLFTSPCHRTYKNNFSVRYDDSRGDWSLSSLEDLINSNRQFFNILNYPTNSNTEYDVSDEYLALMGLYVSEGCLIKSKKKVIKGISISQLENPNKIIEFINIAKNKYDIKEYKHFRKNRYELIYNIIDDELALQLLKDCGQYCREKTLPNWIFYLSKRQANILLNSMISGDGTHEKYSRIYYTTSKKLSDKTQILAMLAGFYSKITKYNCSKSYYVYMSDYRGQFGYINKKLIASDQYSGEIVCFSVPNSTLITRLDGKVAMHGNSKDGYHSVRMILELDQILYEGDLDFERNYKTLLEIRNGLWTKEFLVGTCDKYLNKFENNTNFVVPYEPNERKIKNLLIDCLEEKFGSLKVFGYNILEK